MQQKNCIQENQVQPSETKCNQVELSLIKSVILDNQSSLNYQEAKLLISLNLASVSDDIV